MSGIDTRATRFTRRRYDFIAPFYNFMEWFVEWGWYRHWRKILWNKVGGRSVLELGVGTGKNVPFYPQGAYITAVDLSEKMLARAHAAVSNHSSADAELKLMDVQDMALPADGYDNVVATFVFCSVPDPVLGLKEALRVTKPGGRLLLLEHMLSDVALLAQGMRLLDGIVHWLTGVHIARSTVENVEKAGWKLENVTTLSRGGIFRMIEAYKAT